MKKILLLTILSLLLSLANINFVLAAPAVPSSKCNIKAEVLSVETKRTEPRNQTDQGIEYYLIKLNVREISTIQKLNDIDCNQAYVDEIEKGVIMTAQLGQPALSQGQNISAQVSFSGDELLNGYFLSKITKLSAADLIPESVTDESVNKDKTIKDVMINQLFYQEGSQTTILPEIEDAKKVENFTLDIIDRVKIVFKEPIDLTQDESLFYIENLADYMTFEYLYFWVDHQLLTYFKVPLEITFYDLPYVWEPDIIKDDQFALNKEEISDLRSVIIDSKPQLSFVINEGGGYRVIPHLELYINDLQEIKKENNKITFNGRISDPTAKIFFNLNGQDLTNLQPKINLKTGEFSFELELTEGANLIEVYALSDYGQTGKINKIVNYKKPTITISEENKILDPLYYIIGGLVVLGLFLIFLIIYLVRKK